jgi:transcriptional regulator with XRE-family HTH domain
MGKSDSPLRWVRRKIFGLTQDEMAAVAGVSRPRISRYETSDPPPYEVLQRIRAEAKARGLSFSGDWFFEVPVDERGAA